MPDLIHPTAIVDPAATVGAEVRIGPYAVVEAATTLGDGTVLAAHAVVRSGTVIGPGCFLDSFSVVGGAPQHTAFEPTTESGVRLGARVTLREGATVHRGFHAGATTVLGDDVYVMATAHVGHDCVLGDRVVLAQGAMLGGHVEIGEDVFIGGNAGVHQHVRIGSGAILGGSSTATADVPPFTMAAHRNLLYGLNRIGLRRRGATREVLLDLDACLVAVYRGTGAIRARAEHELREGHHTEMGRHLLEFFLGGKRGFVHPPRRGRGGDTFA